MRQDLLCFGDSNTYGYDPRSFMGDRYPMDIRWTRLLEQCHGFRVRNLGQNGRCIPRSEWELDRAAAQLTGGLAVIMLGSNDLLQQPSISTREVAARMDRFLRRLTVPVLLIAPPPMIPGAWVEDPRLPGVSQELADSYRQLAVELKLEYANAGDCNVELSFDGVHFSPAGHRAFADGLATLL